MIDIDIKDKLLKISNEQYKGSLRFFKPKFTESIIGKESLDHIKKRIDIKLQKSHTLMLYCYLNDIYETPKCVCGCDTKFNTNTKEFMKYCSNKCRFENFSDVVEVRKKSNLAKYGTSNYLASDEGKKKIKDSNIRKYGVSNYTQTEEYKESVRGKKNSPESIQKTKEAHLKRSYTNLVKKFTHCSPLFTVDEFDGVRGYKQYPWSCNKCKSNFISSCDNGSSPICDFCEPTGSKHEVICKELLESLGVDYKYRYRKLPSGKEIDLFVPDKMFGIEMCGLYWHSTAGPSYAKPNHINKLNECEENGIKLFTIFDDEMYNPVKKRIVLNKIKNSVGQNKKKIHARKCKIIELNSDTCSRFLEKYHIQGAIGSTYKYGLTYKNRLVAVITFNKGRTSTGHKPVEGDWELGRYCTIFNFNVVGGASKLITHFIRNTNPNKIYSYADRRWSNGNMYEKIGFSFVKNTTPNYWYTKTFKTREHRVKYQKHKLVDFPSYDNYLTEEDIMKKEKYFKIWDCGSKLYIWNKP
jgi:hypothetical protein